MVCVCCGCNECPNYCSFNVESSLDDSVGTSTVTATPASCTGCATVSESDSQTYGSNTAVTNASVGPGSGVSSGLSGTGRADESTSGGGVSYSRFGSIVVGVVCDFSSKKWKVTALLAAQSFQATEPFYAGIGFQKTQQTDANYFAEVEIGCADVTDEIIVVGDEDGVTINGTLYSWTVDSYTESCTELDGNLDPQACADYLPIVIPEVTVAFSRRAGC